MYHTMYPPQIMVQIMGGQQANGQCPPVQSHTMHIHGASAFHQAEYAKYRSDACSQNRHQMIQVYYHLYRKFKNFKNINIFYNNINVNINIFC